MSVEIHRRSEQLVAEAERLVAESGDSAAIRSYYMLAAEEEARAFDAIPRDRSRTRAVIGISSVRLFMRAEEWEAALRQSHYCLSQADMPEWAIHELNEIVAFLQVEVLRTQRRVLTLLFDLSGETETPALPSRLIGDSMSLLQQAIQSAANDMRSDRKVTAGRIPKSVQDVTQLSLVTMTYGSVGVALIDSTPKQPQLFPEHDLLELSTSAVMNLLSLVSTEADHRQVLEAVGILGPRAAGKLRDFARLAFTSGVDAVKLQWTGIEESISVNLGREQIEDLQLILGESEQETSIIVVDGILAGAERLRKRFAIELDEGQVVGGAIAEDAWEMVADIQRPFEVHCRATIERTVSRSKGGKQSATTYRLLKIEAADG